MTPLLVLLLALAPPRLSDFQISHRARALQPGEVMLVTVESAQSLEQLRGRAFQREFLFFPGRHPHIWYGLVGIDLRVKPGAYTLELEGRGSDGAILSDTYPLQVVDKQFPTRRLTVEERFVNPPPEVRERIRRESRLIGRVLSDVSPAPIWRGPFEAPVAGEATSSFGKRSILNGQPRSPHSGTDFRAGEGTPVKAPNAGRVVLAADLYYSGHSVVLDHGQGLFSFFAHLSEISVAAGVLVQAGQVVGRVGATGRATGPHLHWSVRLKGTRVDPLSLMSVLEDAP